MDPSRSAQDVLRCHVCETPVPPLSCEVCHIYLCKLCAGEHILDESTEHKVVPIKQHLFSLKYPKCSRHSTNNCELYCEDCIIPVCIECVQSTDHQGHRFANLLKYVEAQKTLLQKDLQELESSLLTKHKEFSSDILMQRGNLNKALREIEAAIDEHNSKLQRQLSEVTKKFKSEIVKKHVNKSETLTKALEETALAISGIEKCIHNAKEVLASKDLGLVFEYKSRNDEFRNTPIKPNATLPSFVANEIENDKLFEQFGSFGMTSDETKSDKSTATDNQSLRRFVKSRVNLSIVNTCIIQISLNHSF